MGLPFRELLVFKSNLPNYRPPPPINGVARSGGSPMQEQVIWGGCHMFFRATGRAVRPTSGGKPSSPEGRGQERGLKTNKRERLVFVTEVRREAVPGSPMHNAGST